MDVHSSIKPHRSVNMYSTILYPGPKKLTRSKSFFMMIEWRRRRQTKVSTFGTVQWHIVDIESGILSILVVAYSRHGSILLTLDPLDVVSPHHHSPTRVDLTKRLQIQLSNMVELLPITSF
jgi:hypothetical protein